MQSEVNFLFVNFILSVFITLFIVTIKTFSKDALSFRSPTKPSKGVVVLGVRRGL